MRLVIPERCRGAILFSHFFLLNRPFRTEGCGALLNAFQAASWEGYIVPDDPPARGSVGILKNSLISAMLRYDQFAPITGAGPPQ
jgi:hypothetical protein